MQFRILSAALEHVRKFGEWYLGRTEFGKEVMSLLGDVIWSWLSHLKFLYYLLYVRVISPCSSIPWGHAMGTSGWGWVIPYLGKWNLSTLRCLNSADRGFTKGEMAVVMDFPSQHKLIEWIYGLSVEDFEGHDLPDFLTSSGAIAETGREGGW